MTAITINYEMTEVLPPLLTVGAHYKEATNAAMVGVTDEFGGVIWKTNSSKNP